MIGQSAFDRWLTTPPEGRWQAPEDEVEWPDIPDPCPSCDWVGCHEEGCPDDHRLTVTNRQIAIPASEPSGALVGLTGRCSCGWTYKTNQAASRTPERIEEAHGAHVAEARKEAPL